MRKVVYFLMLVGIIFYSSCDNDLGGDANESVLTDNSEDSNEDNANYSQHNGTESSGMTGNCLSCHYQGGTGEGVFSTGGTVYDSTKTSPYPNATIYFYTAADMQGTLVDSLEVDAYGHFYTTKSIDFSQGLYPAVKGTSGYMQSMSISTTSGACYSCHGTGDTPNIWIK